MAIHFERRYSVLTAFSLAGIFIVSSVPFLSVIGGAGFQFACNLAHAPVYGVLAFLWFKTFEDGVEPTTVTYAATFLVSVACGAFDEWHQSFVPGRSSSIGDLMVDAAGITCILVLIYVARLSGRALPTGTPSITERSHLS